MGRHITVTPAYGRDYKTGKAAKRDWDDNKDFILQCYGDRWDGKPLNREQAEAEGLSVVIRFDENRKVVRVL